jgi:hypothetical protein
LQSRPNTPAGTHVKRAAPVRVKLKRINCNEAKHACHTDRNFTIVRGEGSYQSIPGHPRWGLAPIEMASEGKSPGEIVGPNRL